MTIYKNLLFVVFGLLFFCVSIFPIQAQNTTDRYEISILTCGTGTAEVYQAYGHTGIRVQDRGQNTDEVYNYGMFNFNEDGFLLKFIQGKLLYFVATEDFENFMFDYQYFGRSVREQILNLNTSQKEQLVLALKHNALPENRYYLYDFIYNNCSTQPRDLLRKAIGEDFYFARLSSENTETVRQMVDRHMRYNEWLDFGIDLLLGARFDRVADADTRMFLPAELMTYFDSTEYQGQPIVKDSRILNHGSEQAIPRLLDPTLAFWLLLGVILLMQIFVQNLSVKRGIAIGLLTITGIVGWILTFMWVGTDHYMTKWNMNLLWAIPVYFPLAFFFFKAASFRWVRVVIDLCRYTLILLLLGWCFWPQEFHTAFLPISILIVWCLGVFRK